MTTHRTTALVQPVPLAPIVAAARSGEKDLRAIVDEACDRIEAVDGHVGAFLAEPGRRDRLRSEAAALQAAHPSMEDRPPLFGALVGVKDIFHVAGFETRAGTRLPPEALHGAEGPLVRALRAAGGLILGKTVTTEFAFFEPGPTRNPHDPRRTPGGSSSGSAAAVAAGMCPLALGSQTIGSIVRPAAYCGVVGFKPSFGRVDTAGVIPFSASADQLGWFTDDVAGATLVASVACRDWGGATDVPAPVLGVPTGPYLDQVPPETRAAFDLQMARLAEAGWHVRQVEVMGDIASINTRHKALIAAEMAEAHAPWLAAYEQLYRPRTLELIRMGQAVGTAEVEAARESQAELRARLEATMAAQGVDVWVSPAAMGGADLGLGSTGDPTMNLPWTHAGLPTATVPAGWTDEGLPLGLQASARFGDDERLLAWCAPIRDALSAAGG